MEYFIKKILGSEGKCRWAVYEQEKGYPASYLWSFITYQKAKDYMLDRQVNYQFNNEEGF